MKTWLVAYADEAFLSSAQRLVESARLHGLDECRLWTRQALEQTAFYRIHKSVLDHLRGGGYWLWKPFVIAETLKELAPGDLLVYADAGLELTASFDPLFELCRARAPMMLFAGHYEDVGAPGPNVCGKWTKRDCFAFLDCDQPRYHHAPMVDASLLVLARTRESLAFIREWQLCCGHRQLLTDEANVCGRPNLPEFLEHRHDQSILSLLAAREGLELFRHPSQHGNHAKAAPYRQPGEWLRHPYGSKGVYDNSPYPTLVNHHRGRVERQIELVVNLQRTVPAPRTEVFAAWTSLDVLRQWRPLGHPVVHAEMDVRPGGAYRFATSLSGDPEALVWLAGGYVDVQPPARLVYSWPGPTQVTVAFEDCAGGTAIALRHGVFDNEKMFFYHVRAWQAFLDTVGAAFAAGGAPTAAEASRS